jgi:hypothetical protein
MQRQVLQNPGETRLTEQEANLIVALHSEREQKDGVTTLRDLAETLRISLAEAEKLLAEARSIPEPTEPTIEAVQPQKSIWGSRPGLTKTLLALLVLACIAFAAKIAFVHPSDDTASTPYGRTVAVPAMASTAPAQRGPDLLFRAHQVFEFKQLADSEFEVAVRLSDDYAAHAMPNTTGEAVRDPSQSAAQNRLAESLFEALEYVTYHSPNNATNFYTLSVRTASGSWIGIDVPVDAATPMIQMMESFDGRETVRKDIARFVKEHWKSIRS